MKMLNSEKGSERAAEVVSPRLQYRVSAHKTNSQTPYCKPHNPKMAAPSLASGWRTLQVGLRDLTEKIPTSEKFVGRLPHRLTWVWHNVGQYINEKQKNDK